MKDTEQLQALLCELAAALPYDAEIVATTKSVAGMTLHANIVIHCGDASIILTRMINADRLRTAAINIAKGEG